MERLDEITRDIRRIVVSLSPAARHLCDDASFFDSDTIDSLTFLSILREVEYRYVLPMSSGDVVLSELSSITRIANYVAARRPRRAPTAEAHHG